MRSPFAIIALSILLAPLGARAQTLTVELEATLEAPLEPRASAPVAAAAGATAPVVIVRPPEEDDVVVRPSYEPVRAAPVVVAGPRPVSGPVLVSPAPEREEDDVEGASWLGVVVEGMDLSRLPLTFRAPEVQALRGVSLEGWEGNQALARQTVGGMGLGFGLRPNAFVRGPELRFYLGGGDTEGEWHRAPGEDELELAVESVFVLRAEIAFGLQVELGPVTPFVLARAAVGGAWVDVGVRDARLGRIGTETLDGLVAELGVEAGLAIELGEGAELGAAFRGSFLGTESYGGVVHVGWHGE